MIDPFIPKYDIEPYPVTTLDIETDNGDLLAIGMAWSTDTGDIHYETFLSWGEWLAALVDEIEWSTKPNANRLKFIYAHNGGGFDWLSLLEYGVETRTFDDMEAIMSGGNPIGINIKLGKHTIRLRDSYRLLPSTLKGLSASFDVPTPKQDITQYDIEHMREYMQNQPEKFWEYLKADVLALQQVIQRFWQSIYDQKGSIGALPMTLPSLAFKLWRMTLDDSVQTPTERELLDLERKAYTGGRTECFDVAVADVSIYDANSLYPSVMISGEFPTSYAGAWVSTYRGKPGVYEITYEQTNRTVKPVLRDDETNAFTYTGSGAYVHAEIELLKEIGGTVICTRGYEYDHTGPLFRDFISEWYSERLEAQHRGDEAMRFVAKILMNSSYGKFGQQEIGEKVVLWSEAEIEAALNNGDIIKPLGIFTVIEDERTTNQIFVGVAAYITAYARIALYRQMHHVEACGGHVYAVDTDSVHISGASIPTGENLGEWKHEFTGEGAYLGKKLYSLKGDGIKAKGIGKQGRAKLTHDIFRDMAIHGGSLPVEFPTFPTFREVLSGRAKACKMTKRVRTIRPTATME